MAKTYDNNLRGVLFTNEEKTELADKQDTTKWADYEGSCEIDGEHFWLSGWIKEAQKGERQGQKFLSLSFKKNEQRGDSGGGRKTEQVAKPAAKGGNPF